MALCYHLPQLNNLLVDQSWRSSINTIISLEYRWKNCVLSFTVSFSSKVCLKVLNITPSVSFNGTRPFLICPKKFSFFYTTFLAFPFNSLWDDTLNPYHHKMKRQRILTATHLKWYYWHVIIMSKVFFSFLNSLSSETL